MQTEAQLHRLDFFCSEEEAELIAGVLAWCWELGWEELMDGDAVRVRLHHPDRLALEQAAASVHAQLPGIETEFEAIPDRNWALAWREYFTAVLCGEDFVVLAPWMQGEHPYKDRHAIVIDPKMAFGTGHHPTTALCLAAVSDLYRAGRLANGFRALDFGAGSGILCIGCALLGGSGVAVDNDPLATENCLENLKANGVAERIRVVTGSIEAVQEEVGAERFDIVLANILAEPLIEMARDIVDRVKEGGVLVLSGILAVQVEQVRAAYEALGWPAPRVVIDGEWAGLIWE